MAKPFFQSAMLRNLLLIGYRAYARAQILRKGSRIFINSIPKAGTHLLTAELSRSPDLQNSGLWVRERYVNKLTRTGERLKDFKYDDAAFRKFAGTVRNGQYFTGHLNYDPELVETLRELGIATIFVSRHPLDILVSQYHYIVGLKRHSKHEFFMSLPSDEARYDILLNGHHAEPYMDSLQKNLEDFAGWLDAPGVLSVRFEDLVGDRGGGSDRVRAETLARIAAHAGVRFIDSARPDPARSATFRKGRTGTWTETLSPAFVNAARQSAGREIKAYGYDC